MIVVTRKILNKTHTLTQHIDLHDLNPPNAVPFRLSQSVKFGFFFATVVVARL